MGGSQPYLESGAGPRVPEQPYLNITETSKAVDKFLGNYGNEGYDYQSFLTWLKENPGEITEACFQLKDRFQKGDDTGMLLVAILLQKALLPNYESKDPYENLDIES